MWWLLLAGALAAPSIPTRTAWRGGDSPVVVTGLPPRATVYLGGSTLGPGPGPCPPLLQGECLGLRAPRQLGQATADANGDAVFTLRLPSTFGPDTIWLQAVTATHGAALSPVVRVGVLAPDTDRDGLDDGAELLAGSDPHLPDTDGDGLDDGQEILRQTDPTLADTDGDGLDDPTEVGSLLNPRAADTDGGGWSDGEEVLTWHTDPADPTDDLLIPADSDSDALTDEDEVLLGLGPTEPDSDCDGVIDGVEVLADGTDPRDPASFRPTSVGPVTPGCVRGTSAPPALRGVDCPEVVDTGTPWICTLDAFDPDGGAITWTATGPPGLLVDPAGTLSLATAPLGTWSVYARATDAGGAALDLDLRLQVTGLGGSTAGSVGPNGLLLTLPTLHPETSQVQLQVPRGAFPSGTRVTLTELVGAPRLGDFPAVDIDAEGQQPAVPLTLRWTLSGPALVGLVEAESPVLTSTGVEERWVVEPITAHLDPASGTATTTLSHLSRIAMLRDRAAAVGGLALDMVEAVLDKAQAVGTAVASLQQPLCIRGPDTDWPRCELLPDERLRPGQANCVLLHGILSNGDAFDQATAPDIGTLAALEGSCDQRLVVDYPTALDQRLVAAMLAARLERVRDPGATYMIIAHSNGGLVARSLASMDHPAAQAMLGILTLDTPHRGGQVEALSDLLGYRSSGTAAALLVASVGPGIANLIATPINLDTPLSYLNLLRANRPIACVGAADPAYRELRQVVTDGLVHRDSALAACPSSELREAPWINPYLPPNASGQEVLTAAQRFQAQLDLHAIGLSPKVHSEVHRRVSYVGAIELLARLWQAVDHDHDGIPNEQDCDLFGTCGPAEAHPDEDLQAAIDALSEGDVLELHAGTYDIYRLQITTPGVTIRAAGDGPVVLSGTGDQQGAIWVAPTATDVLFEGLTLYNTTDGSVPFDAGIFSQADRTTVRDCTFSGLHPRSMHVYFQRANDGRVEDCRFDTFYTAIVFDDAAGTVQRVHIRDGVDGIVAAAGAEVALGNALIARVEQGFLVADRARLDAGHVTIIDSSQQALWLDDDTCTVAFHATLLAGNAVNLHCEHPDGLVTVDDVYAEDGSSSCDLAGSVRSAILALDADGYPTPASQALVDRRPYHVLFPLDVDGRIRPFDGDGDGIARSDLGAVERMPAHLLSCSPQGACVCDAGWIWDGVACVDIDECPSDPCAGHPCQNTPGGYTCDCPSTHIFDGATCTDILTCAPDPCPAPLDCTDDGFDLTCACPLGSTAVGDTCAFPRDCASLLRARPNTPSGRYWIDPQGDGTPLRTWCDMTSGGGGWTLLLHAGLSFHSNDEALLDADCYGHTCASRAWEELPLGADLRIDGSDLPMDASSPPVSVVIVGIDPLTRGQPLRARMEGPGWWPLEQDNNNNVRLRWSTGFDCGTWVDFGDAACGSNIFVLHDDLDRQYLGGRYSRASEWGNQAGWPGDPNWNNYNYWPDYLRIWTR